MEAPITLVDASSYEVFSNWLAQQKRNGRIWEDENDEEEEKEEKEEKGRKRGRGGGQGRGQGREKMRRKRSAGGTTEVERKRKLWGDAKRKLKLDLGKMHSLFVIFLFCFFQIVVTK
jgi:hypothetical protein